MQILKHFVILVKWVYLSMSCELYVYDVEYCEVYVMITWLLSILFKEKGVDSSNFEDGLSLECERNSS